MALTTVQGQMVGNSDASTFAPGLPIYENTASVAATGTLTANTNAMSVGPITVNAGVIYTLETNTRWVIL
jgi:hypothetical protein